MPVIQVSEETETRGLQFFFSFFCISGKKSVRPCLKSKPGVTVHTYNPSYLGVRDRRIKVGKNARLLSQKTL
jgi:hypothetical protein